MTQQQNDRKGQNPPQQPGQQAPGFQQERDREGEQNPYGGQREPITNIDRDRNPTNAGNQGRSEHPNFDSQREGQKPDRDRQRPDDPNSMKNVDNVIPEVPLRKEERERKTPTADPTKEQQKRSDPGTMSDSSVSE